MERYSSFCAHHLLFQDSPLPYHARVSNMYIRALKIDETVFGLDHPKIANRVSNLGTVLQDMDDYAGAKAAYERALKIYNKFLPPDHPDIKIVRGYLESL